MTQKQNLSNNTKELFLFDDGQCADFDYIIGTDEAGRGPGAGPVFAAAVCFKTYDETLIKLLNTLNDSKKLSEKCRLELFEVIIQNSICSIHSGSVEDIERKNILNTSLDCMKEACLDVRKHLMGQKCLVLVDGNKLIKNFPIQQKTIVKGDAKSAAIAAASILAKVTRDKFMTALSDDFPQYGWDKNKGYLTGEHIEAIKKFGPTKWHRPKFLRKILDENSQLNLFETEK